MAESIETQLRYARLIAEIARVFGPRAHQPGDDPVRRPVAGSGAGLGRVMVEALVPTVIDGSAVQSDGRLKDGGAEIVRKIAG